MKRRAENSTEEIEKETQQQIEHFIKEGQLIIRYDQFQHLLSKDPSLYNKIQQLITTKQITFPFKKYHLEKNRETVVPKQEALDYAKTLFTNLLKYKPSFTNTPCIPQNIRFHNRNLFPFKFSMQGASGGSGEWAVLETLDKEYFLYDMIGDIFQEEERLTGVRKDQKLGVMGEWEKGGGWFVRKLIEKKKDVFPYALREECYRQVKECNQFKPSVALCVYKTLKATRILDFSAGWGDRLIAAMAHRVMRYVGVDPNISLKTGHLEAVHTLYPLAYPSQTENLKDPSSFPDNIQIIYSPFQTAVLPEGQTYDLIFTSPPFFDFEIYSKNPGQSVDQYPEFYSWMENFLFTSLSKAWSVLDIDGYLALHITDVYKTQVCEAMNLHIQLNLPGSLYCGVIGTKGSSGKTLPIWVWKKTSSDDEYRISEATNCVSTHFKWIKIAARAENQEKNMNRIREALTELSDLNPAFQIRDVNGDGHVYKLIDDSFLVGGTKQRAAAAFLKILAPKETKEVAIATMAQGYAQLALTVACNRLGMQSHIFMPRSFDNITKKVIIEPLTVEAQRLGAVIHFIDGPNGNWARMDEVKRAASDWSVAEKGRLLAPFGLDDRLYIDVLAEAIKMQFPMDLNPKHIWCVAGSCAILRSLYKAFPNAHLHAVKVGKEIDWLVEKKRTDVYDATRYENFTKEAEIKPPYDSVLRYDAKLWRFALKYGKTGDFLWNVGKDPIQNTTDEIVKKE
eukprot:TRINITY_DN14779_c0_g1_i1.p1 TRINITY_DN14779_c0_g1~~TRINITY_DN14779_c0_g1_i1.p1  ORF type:complete len:735 (+),score=182.46 TRINITY_DN14779_c0_g1_i1:21-2225(+)